MNARSSSSPPTAAPAEPVPSPAGSPRSDAQPAFPLHVDGATGVRLVDLDVDGSDEIIVCAADGALHAFDARGAERNGFPASTGPLAHLPGFADFENDNRIEIVAAGM